MQTHIRLWGNSLAVRIPRSFAMEAGLESGAPVDLGLVDGRLVITPCGPEPPALADLLAAVTDANVHGEVEWGPAQGREVW